MNGPRPIPWSWYSEPATLALERDRIFERSWQYVAHLGEVDRPGSYVARAAGHIPVAVVRDEEGVLRAFLNVCRHRGHEVVSGAGSRRTLQCPYHAWTYGLDGALRAAPRSEREPGFDVGALSLVRLHLDTWGQLIFVSAAAEPWPLAEVLEGIPQSLASGGIDLDTLVFDRRVEYEIEANWKVVMENYLECYHCPVAHPDFSKAVDVDPDSYVLEPGTWSSSQYASARDGDGLDVERGQFHFVWPNLRINVFPGLPNLSIGPAFPTGPGKTSGFFDYFFAESVSADEREELIAFDAQVGREDRALVESVQRGMRSGLLDYGRLLPESEQLIAHFQTLVAETLGQ